MRRRFGILLPALLALTLLVAPTAALADVVAGDDLSDGGTLVLAAEAGEPVGPEPQPRTDENNPAGQLYADQEIPFTWGAAWLLGVGGILGIVAMLLFFRFRVQRPEQSAGAGRR
jgi:hypothetical protein